MASWRNIAISPTISCLPPTCTERIIYEPRTGGRRVRKLGRASDTLLICLLVLLSIGVIAYGLGYAPRPGTAPFWAVLIFVWAMRVLAFVVPILCVGYAVYLLWRMILGRDSIHKLIQCAGLLMMGIASSPFVAYGSASRAVLYGGIVLFAIGRRIERIAGPSSSHE